MKNSKLLILIAYILLIILQTGCIQPPIIHEPDLEKFNLTVHSTALRDSLKNGVLTPGMPYFVVNQLFEDWPETSIKIPVASLGSKQRLVETEGWGRDYNDPNIQIYLDEYKTGKGELKVWYQLPNFYRMDISSGDTLCVYFKDSVFCSPVNFLRKFSALTVKDSLALLPQMTNLYAEIHYKDHNWRKVSYWYTVQMLSNFQTFILKDLQYEIYPIELLELDNEPITSFRWR